LKECRQTGSLSLQGCVDLCGRSLSVLCTGRPGSLTKDLVNLSWASLRANHMGGARQLQVPGKVRTCLGCATQSTSTFSRILLEPKVSSLPVPYHLQTGSRCNALSRGVSDFHLACMAIWAGQSHDCKRN